MALMQALLCCPGGGRAWALGEAGAQPGSAALESPAAPRTPWERWHPFSGSEDLRATQTGWAPPPASSS